MSRLPAVVRVGLVVLIMVGFVGFMMTPGTVAEFTDGHGGAAEFSAGEYPRGNGGGQSSGLDADAGGPYSVAEGGTVQLDGSGSSSSQGSIHGYSWVIVEGPGQLSGANTAQPTYTAPNNVSGNVLVTVELTVEDQQGNTATDTATITVNDTG